MVAHNLATSGTMHVSRRSTRTDRPGLAIIDHVVRRLVILAILVVLALAGGYLYRPTRVDPRSRRLAE
jgi:hypothetical protein